MTFEAMQSIQDTEKIRDISQTMGEKIYQTLDSISKESQHTFKGLDTNNCTFIFSPKIINPKNKDSEDFKIMLMLEYKKRDFKTEFYMTMFKNILVTETKNVIENIYPLFEKTATNMYHLYIPTTNLDISKIIQKNSPKNILQIVFEKRNKNSIFFDKIASMLLGFNNRKQYFNLFWNKKTMNKNLTKIDFDVKNKSTNYILYLKYKGKNLVLKLPDGKPIETTFEFEKKCFDEGDYSEFSFLVNRSLSSFIMMNK